MLRSSKRSSSVHHGSLKSQDRGLEVEAKIIGANVLCYFRSYLRAAPAHKAPPPFFSTLHHLMCDTHNEAHLTRHPSWLIRLRSVLTMKGLVVGRPSYATSLMSLVESLALCCLVDVNSSPQ